jgi:hypothetical protein
MAHARTALGSQNLPIFFLHHLEFSRAKAQSKKTCGSFFRPRKNCWTFFPERYNLSSIIGELTSKDAKYRVEGGVWILNEWN